MLLKWLGNAGETVASGSASGCSATASFDATVGIEYRCYAVSSLGGRIEALIVDDTSRPNWYPLDLFSIQDGSVPTSWELGLLRISSGVHQLIVGYREMARNPNHYLALIEREADAVKIFFKQTGIEGLEGRKIEAVVESIGADACILRLEGGDPGFLENSRNQQRVNGAEQLRVGDAVTVAVIDAKKYPIRVSSLDFDLDTADISD
ncbi:hypothetical protein ACWDYH_39045 [Nocardia goodfellowii]